MFYSVSETRLVMSADLIKCNLEVPTGGANFDTLRGPVAGRAKLYETRSPMERKIDRGVGAVSNSATRFLPPCLLHPMDFGSRSDHRHCRVIWHWPKRVILVALVASFGCNAASSSEPEGSEALAGEPLAKVGNTILTTDDVARVDGQLGRYAQSRFRGDEGQQLLLQALIDAEALAQAAKGAGLGDDPRVKWAIVEEMAGLALAAEIERRVPEDEIAGDRQRLRAYYDAHLDAFMQDERRSFEGVAFPDLDAAEAAHAAVVAGERTLESYGEVLSTPAKARDDERFPGAHPIVFARAAKEGELLGAPLVLARDVMVARLVEIEAATPKSFDDPSVQSAIVEAIRAPLVAEAKAAYLAELRARYGDPAAADAASPK